MPRQVTSVYKGSGQLTREQFLFYEMRITARLLQEGLDAKEVINRIAEENLFQYPTEKTIGSMARTCIARLKALDDEDLVKAIANQPADVAKQICLYAMMKRYRLVWDFMVTVIGEKFRSKNMSFGKIDMNSFFLSLQEQDDYVAGWSDSTVERIKRVLKNILVENEYLKDRKSEQLSPVWLNSILENAIKSNNDDIALAAFNYFS